MEPTRDALAAPIHRMFPKRRSRARVRDDLLAVRGAMRSTIHRRTPKRDSIARALGSIDRPFWSMVASTYRNVPNQFELGRAIGTVDAGFSATEGGILRAMPMRKSAAGDPDPMLSEIRGAPSSILRTSPISDAIARPILSTSRGSSVSAQATLRTAPICTSPPSQSAETRTAPISGCRCVLVSGGAGN